MMNEEDILNASNDGLRKLLLQNFPQNKIGPVETQTRNFYEKKLIKHLKEQKKILKQEKIIPGVTVSKSKETQMDLNNNNVTDQSTSPLSSMQSSYSTTGLNFGSNETDLTALSNDELYKLLKRNNISAGPVSDETRSVYIKKIMKKMKESVQNPNDLIVINDDDDENNARVPKQEPIKYVEPEPEIQILDDNDTVTPKSNQPPSSSTVDSKNGYKKIYPPLEFKLLTPSSTAPRTVRIERCEVQPSFGSINTNRSLGGDHYVSSSYNFPDTNRQYENESQLFDSKSYSRPNNSFELYNRRGFRSNDYENDSNINYMAAANLRDTNRPLINLTSLFDKKPPNYQNMDNFDQNIPAPFGQNAIRSNIYHEPAPPQPAHLASLKPKNSIFQYINSVTVLTFILILLIFVFLFLMFAPENNNPIENI